MRLLHRPNQAVDYGTVETNGSGNVLGDALDNTRKQYYEDSGSILLYPTFDPSLVPDGKEIIAVREGHKQENGGSILGLHNGWVMGYIRINGDRVNKTRTYKQDGYSLNWRPIEGPPLYNAGLKPWLPTDISKMSSDVGAASGEFGPNKNKLWCICNEAYIVIILDDPVPVPTISYPAAGSTIATSSVDFQAVVPAPQPEQPVAAVFQVARDAGFTQEVQTFVGGLNPETTAGTKSMYDSVIGKDSYTNLGPGLWRIRVKGKDYRGKESAWGATTTFTITHSALPVPTLTNPGSGTTKATPYGYREGAFATAPSGERCVGLQFQFCQNADFTTGPVISWTNNQMGRFNIGAVGYTSDPDPTVEPGKNGNKVSSDDPSQYLKQGTWRGRVRAVDIWGQTGAWSTALTFTVAHPPVVNDVWPSGGKAFDDDAFPVQWQFGDPWTGDSQTAYQVIVRDPSTNIIYNTGKVVSPFNNTDVTIPDTWLEQNLNLSIQIWDKDDVASSLWTGSFKHSRAPIITLPYPAPDEAIITGQPSLNWTVQFAPGASQKSRHIAFIRRDTGVIEYKTPVELSSSMSWLAPTVVLKNVSAYQLALTITDTNDLYTTLLRNFSTDYVRPPTLQCSAFAETFEDDGYVTVLWPDVDVDPLFMEYRVYKKLADVEDASWEHVGTVVDSNTFEFHDWSTSGEHAYRYSITQVVMLFGALVESLQDEYGDIVKVRSSHYWLIVPHNESLNTKLYMVVADGFTDKVEQSSHVILGGGGNRVNYGSPIGMDGSMSAQIRGASNITASEMRLRIRRLQFEATWCFMRDPFGNFNRIAIGDIGIKRIEGVGMAQYVDVEIPYKEVGRPSVTGSSNVIESIESPPGSGNFIVIPG